MDTHSHLQYVSNLHLVRELLIKLWTNSKFFRIITLATGSITGLLSLRFVYVKTKRKYYGTPPGPMGPPFIGYSLMRLNPEWLSTVPEQYGDVTDVGGGLILINNPVLAKNIHDDPRAMNSMFGGETFSNIALFMENGKPWSDRRRMIQSNLMSTMKSEFVETAVQQFVSNNMFRVIDGDISEDTSTDIKPLLKPIAFNLVLQACYGKTLESMEDELWTNWDQLVSSNTTKMPFQFLTGAAMGSFDGKMSVSLQNMLTGDDLVGGFQKQIDYMQILEENAKDVGAERDENVKLFSDFVDDYVKMENGRYQRRHLLGDMMTMFMAATDTTVSTMSFALLEAARNPKLQQELHDEVIKAFGDGGIKLKGGGITKIPKLRAFLHEVLRIHAVMPATGARKIMDEGVTIGGYKLLKGSMPFINTTAINMNPKYWVKDYDEEQHKDIDMWSLHLEFWLENGAFVKKLQSDHFFTFHSGKRDCVGQTLALKVMLVVLAMIFGKYELDCAEKSKKGRIEWVMGHGIIEPKETIVVFRQRN